MSLFIFQVGIDRLKVYCSRQDISICIHDNSKYLLNFLKFQAVVIRSFYFISIHRHCNKIWNQRKNQSYISWWMNITVCKIGFNRIKLLLLQEIGTNSILLSSWMFNHLEKSCTIMINQLLLKIKHLFAVM